MGRVKEGSVAETRRGLAAAVVVREVVRQSLRDDIVGLSAELAFRFFLALFPFFVFLSALGAVLAAALDFRNPARRAVELLGEVLPREAATMLEGQLEQVVENVGRGELVAGGLLAVVVATSGTNAIIKGLNRAYGVKEHRPMWKRYLVALALTLAAGTSSVLALLVFVPFRLSSGVIGEALGLDGYGSIVVHVVAAVVAVVLLVIAVGLLFRVGPAIRLPLRVVMPGAALFAGLWLLAAFLFGVYAANFADYTSTYGILAGVVIVLVWFYVLGFVLLLSAEANQVIHALSDPADMAERRRQAEAEGEAEFRPTRDLGVPLGDEESDRGTAAT